MDTDWQNDLHVLVERALRDEEVLSALAEEHIPVEDAKADLQSDAQLRAQLRDARSTKYQLTDEMVVVDPYEELPNLTAADLGWFARCGGLVFGYQLLLVRAWSHLPAGLAVFSVVGFVATLALAIRIAHRHVPILRAFADRLTKPPASSAGEYWRAHVLDDLVRPAVAEYIKMKRNPCYSSTLTFRAVRDLDAAPFAGSPVMSSALHRLRTAVARSTTGAIALAGNRGVGKTTAIRLVAAGVIGDNDEMPPLAVIASAPARYDARDFVLYLHGLLCREIIARTRNSTPSGDRWLGFAQMAGPVLRRARALTVARSLLGYCVQIAVVILLASWAWGKSPVAFVTRTPPIFAHLSGWRIVVLILAGLVALGLVIDFGWFAVPRVSRTAAGIRSLWRSRNPVLLELRTVAGQQLRRIRFLQTYTTGWSGKLALPLKAEAGWTRSNQSAEQQLTYPEVVDTFRAFAEYAAERLRAAGVAHRLVIAIDELDKIAEPEKAQELINEIKGVFDVPGCLFLVSMSDDAIISFERRGIPTRDAFDSAFAEMIRMENFTRQDTRGWIGRRVFGLPEQFVCLCHCLSGGLPRDLRRTVIEMLDIAANRAEPPALSAVVGELVRKDLDRKAHAFSGTASNLSPSPGRSELISVLVTLPTLTDYDELASLAVKHNVALELSDPIAILRRQVSTYLLFCATICELFTDDLTEDQLYGVPGDGEPQLLSIARQQMAVDPQVSWNMLIRFRAARDLEPAD